MKKTPRRRATKLTPQSDAVAAIRAAIASMFEQLERRVLMAAFAPADEQQLVDTYMPQLHTEWNAGGYLTNKSTAAPLTIALDYLRSHTKQLGLQAADVANPIVTDQYTDASSGMTYVYLRQRANGLEVINANANFSIRRDGRILSMNSGFIGGLTTELSKQPVAPTITAAQAAAQIAPQIDVRLTGAIAAGRIAGTDRHSTLRNSSLSQDEIPTKLQYVANADGTADLSWNMHLRLPSGEHWYDISLNANGSKKLTFASDWTDHIESYNVYPIPTEAPNDGVRSIVSDPADATASPFGWLDTNGVPGPELTITKGNNVSAYTDTDANNVPDAGSQPDGGPSTTFNFPIDLTMAPSTYRPAAVTNLFYWNNILHDVHYHYGFTEAAGNFQTNNYGHGGSGNDQVLAEAQDGSGTSNANFDTPPDGLSGRMQMYLFTSPNPDRDGDLDAMVMVHEYGHGVSNRLTGGPANSNALDNIQSGGMGEGWSDFYSLMFTQKPTDTQNIAYPVGTYVLGQTTSGAGIRRKPYSYNMTIDPLAFDAYGTSGTTPYGVARSTEVHNTGELWCSALWDINWLMINKYGYDSNLYTGYTAAAGPGHAGNKLALQLVMDALKLQPANPSFIQARDAILQADQNLTGGANQTELWQAFARRGLGVSAATSGSNSTSFTPGFDVPVADPNVITVTPTSSVVPIGSIDIRFNQPMDTASFSVADDVVSYTGPGAVDLLGTISSFSWPQTNTLRINFSPTAATGSYTMVIGPNILAADNENPMDQNGNGTPGEIPGDRYSAVFTYTDRIGPDGFGYQAGAWSFENLDLVPGGPGVTSLLTSVDDVSAVINLLSNSFRLYNTTYSGNAATGANASDNGFVSFGASSTVSANTDLTSPSAARFAALWDDWETNQTADDQVLYRFDDLNGDSISDRLVVEWNAIHNFNAPGNPVTFQAIFQLNTGSTPGVMIANYVDVDAGNPAYNNGASSTVGIKDTNTPPPFRLLVSQDTAFPWVGNGKAIRIATDWTKPTVTTTAFNYLTSHSLTFQFSENVSASLSTSDLTLMNNTTGLPVPTANIAVSYNTGTNTATFTFPGYAGGILPDGDYTATIAAAGVTDPQWNPLAANGVNNFFVLAGDANHDRTVNVNDFTILATNFGLSGRNFAQGDFNYDGLVNVSDFAILASKFGVTLAPDGSVSRSGEQVPPLPSGTPRSPTGQSTVSSFGGASALPGPASPSSSIFGDSLIGDKKDRNDLLNLI